MEIFKQKKTLLSKVYQYIADVFHNFFSEIWNSFIFSIKIKHVNSFIHLFLPIQLHSLM